MKPIRLLKTSFWGQFGQKAHLETHVAHKNINFFDDSLSNGLSNELLKKTFVTCRAGTHFYLHP